MEPRLEPRRGGESGGRGRRAAGAGFLAATWGALRLPCANHGSLPTGGLRCGLQSSRHQPRPATRAGDETRTLPHAQHRHHPRRTSATRVAASVALVAGATAVAGLGTFGSFTSSTEATEAVGSGQTKITMADQGGQGLSVPAVNLVPGDTVERAVQLTRAEATEGFGSVKLTTTAGATPSILTSDATDGLQLSIDQCSTAWVKAADSTKMSCSGKVTSILAAGPALGADRDLGEVTKTLNGETKVSNLRVSLALPQSADNRFQLKSDTVNFTFNATQRAAEAR